MKRWHKSDEFPDLTVYYDYDYDPGTELDEPYENLEITSVVLEGVNIFSYIDDGILKTLDDELKDKKPYLNDLNV